MDRASLEAAISTLDVWLIVFGIIAAIGAVGAAGAGYLRFRRSNELNAIFAEENLSQKRAIEAARAEAAEASARAAEANRIAESERLARLKIEQRLADRRLTPEQRASISAKLAPFAGQEIRVVCHPEPEPEQIASDVISALEKANWRIISEREIGIVTRGMLVDLGSNADTDALPAAGALAGALADEDLMVAGPARPTSVAGVRFGNGDPFAPIPMITLRIGPK